VTEPRDEYVHALDDVVEALGEACEEASTIEERASRIRSHHSQQLPLASVADTSDGRIVQHVTKVLDRLNKAGTRLRRASARAMRDEGMTTDQIASVLGVTRQRVSALTRRPDAAPREPRVTGRDHESSHSRTVFPHTMH
jgi:DNA-directed RNA polymerase specialized sigma subunit